MEKIFVVVLIILILSAVGALANGSHAGPKYLKKEGVTKTMAE